MGIRRLIFCLSVAIAMAEPPVFAGVQHQDERVLPLNPHTDMPHVFQQLPQDHSFADFLLPPVSSYGAPAVSANLNVNSADFETPAMDSYNTAFLHSSSQQHQTGYDHVPRETQVIKHIYVHAPPKDFEQDDAIRPRLIHQMGPKQKHYKIVFIKAPDAYNVRTPIAPPLPQNEEKTLIYVLHKKPETHPDIVIPTPEPTKPSKPEVYFIKYKSNRQEAPVYGPPTALNEIQSSRRADEDNHLSEDDFITMKSRPNELEESTTSQPQYEGEMEQQQAQAKFVTAAPSVFTTNFLRTTTESNSANEDIQTTTTTVEPINQYLPPQTTPAPIRVIAMDDSTHLPATSYGAAKRNRFFIKRRK